MFRAARNHGHSDYCKYSCDGSIQGGCR